MHPISVRVGVGGSGKEVREMCGAGLHIPRYLDKFDARRAREPKGVCKLLRRKRVHVEHVLVRLQIH